MLVTFILVGLGLDRDSLLVHVPALPPQGDSTRSPMLSPLHYNQLFLVPSSLNGFERIMSTHAQSQVAEFAAIRWRSTSP